MIYSDGLYFLPNKDSNTEISFYDPVFHGLMTSSFFVSTLAFSFISD